MITIKKFVPVQLRENYSNDTIKADLCYGSMMYHLGKANIHREEFDTEAEALCHAFNANRWAEWVILPVIRFDNFH